MARRVSRAEAPAYLAQAMEFLDSARDNLVKGRSKAASFEAIQAMINANDALTVYFTEERASMEHAEALRLHLAVVKITNDSSFRPVLKKALEFRSTAGYLIEPVSISEARALVADAGRFCEWVRKSITQ